LPRTKSRTAHTTPFAEVQQETERALEHLAARDVKPVTRAILDLAQDRFYAAYTTDPNHPLQQSVTVAWERAGGAIQASVSLLDFGVPWRGALKDMFSPHGMTPHEFQRELMDKPARYKFIEAAKRCGSKCCSRERPMVPSKSLLGGVRRGTSQSTWSPI
jgi:hypothetical protein